MDLTAYVGVVRRRWRAIVLTILVAVGAAAALSLSTTPVYESSTRLFISTAPASATDAYAGSQFSEQRATSYVELARSVELAKRAIELAKVSTQPTELVKRVTASVVPDTVVLQLSVDDENPERARALAQAYADAMEQLVGELETPVGEQIAPIRATIIDPASSPIEPIRPRTIQTLALSLLLGLALGLVIALGREQLDRTVKNPEDLLLATQAPVLGAISFDREVKRNPLISSLPPTSPRYEAFRVLRTNTQFLDVDVPAKLLVVTSSLPHEGKSTTAVNLAIALSETGQRVLLVECDLRSPRVGELLGLDGATGVTSVLFGKVPFEDAVQRLPGSALDVLDSGALPPNPAELLQSQAMGALLQTAREAYDNVVIDAPPLLPVTDASLLATHADGVIMVVRHGKTNRDQVRQAADRLHAVDARILGVILNMVPAQQATSHYSYGYEAT